ncbi:hypothetical protein [Cellulosimicrobium funkei]|uniref:hypothetical protein n=1 Tax=Cellulosimicrobium funkei TaxID=264251 RepID=UPI003444D36F
MVTKTGEARAKQTRLTLSESVDAEGTAAPWIGAMFMLGRSISRFAHERLEEDRQLVVALSLPGRDFAAALLACGWAEQSVPGQLSSFEAIPEGAPVRMVTCGKVVTAERYLGLQDLGRNGVGVRTSNGTFQRPSVRAVAQLDEIPEEAGSPRPEPGTFASYVGIASKWDRRLANPAADLAIVGTRAWLDEDFNSYLGVEGVVGVPTRIGDILLPSAVGAPAVGTYVYSAARFADVDVPDRIQAVILEGTAAIRYLNAIEAPVVICLLDRSVVDETAADIVLARRSSRGRPLDEGALNWSTPAGVEAIAFTVKRKAVTW